MKSVEQIMGPFNEELAITIVRSEGESKKHPIVIMAPGFTSSRENKTNSEISKRLLSHGISSVMVDLSGHGESEGDISDQTILKAEKELECVVDHVKMFDWVNTSKIALLGASFSGNSMILLASENSEICALGLKSPITDYVGTRIHQLGKNALEEWKNSSSIILNDGTTSKYQFIIDAKKTNTYKSVEKVQCPIYIVQGDNDEDIPNSHINELSKHLKKKDFLNIISGATHGYGDEEHFNTMIQSLSNFLITNLKN